MSACRAGSTATLAMSAPIELHELRSELKDVPQAGIACSGIVDGPSNPGRHVRDRVAQCLIVVDRLALGDLEDDPAVCARAG